jgi:hypothetical protein
LKLRLVRAKPQPATASVRIEKLPEGGPDRAAPGLPEIPEIAAREAFD